MKVMNHKVIIFGLCLLCVGKIAASAEPQQPSSTADIPAAQPAQASHNNPGQQPAAQAGNAAPHEQPEIHPQEANADLQGLRAAAAQPNQPPIVVQIQVVPQAHAFPPMPELHAHNQGIEGFFNRHSGALGWCGGGAAAGYFSQAYRKFKIPGWLWPKDVSGLQLLIKHPFAGTLTVMGAGACGGYAGYRTFKYFRPDQQQNGQQNHQ